ncbi:hypothetical protein [Psychrobacter aestuarii]|uniref:SPOR domain-containing protein n=1 Tax=Psychrobacter aestuarii TaxID=556327 RepID=A0ABP3FIX9_9GAMM|nr:hypothetical protein [Psychrobacter aestuarii]
MALFSATNSPNRTSYRRQALIWLMTTLIMGVITALVWMFSQTPAIGAKIENAPITAPQAQDTLTAFEQPSSIKPLHELDTDVQPINFEETVRDLRDYPDEFKDKRYLIANKGKWTVQVMNVAENDVITNYLEGRDDRKKFAYFRYRDSNNQPRYMLTYGIMSSPQEAVGAAKLIDFDLPTGVRVLPEEINRYLSIIDNYERPEPLKDLSTHRARTVRLKPTRREVPVRQPKPAPVVRNDNSAERAPAQSIRQSADTADTLSVNEERTVANDDSANTSSNTATEAPKSTPKNNDAPANDKPPAAEKPNKGNNGNGNSGNNGNGNGNNGNGKNNGNNGNGNGNKNNSDSMKALIEDKSK